MKFNPFWFLLLNNDQKDKILKLGEDNKVEYKTWFIFSIVLPLAPFIISILISFLLVGNFKWGLIINNGSLPIISYGFITSGIVYLMERINNKELIHYQLRERIMSFSVLFLFLNSAIFIFETTNKELLTTIQHQIILVFSLLVFYYSLQTSKVMFLLQKKVLDKTYDTQMRDEANAKHGLNW